MLKTHMKQDVTIRHDLRPGDLGRVAALHGELYAAEYAFNHVFEGYVAESLGELGRGYRPERDRLWIAERDGRMLGSIGILGREGGAAQLRWLLVHPEARGRRLGRRLVQDALAFCRATGCTSVYLWTVDLCADAARLYLALGFRRTEVLPPASPWGPVVCEERYDLAL